jgi:hypothetical protein
MTREVAISVERLGKSYMVGHESRARYGAARRRGVGRSPRAQTADMLRGKPIVPGDVVENSGPSRT